MFSPSRFVRLAMLVIAANASLAVCSAEEEPATSRPATRQPRVVRPASANQEKFTYYLFWRENNNATKESLAALKSSLENYSEKATYTTVNVSDPATRSTVAQFNISRYPMPLVLAVAPNGAVSGVFTTPITPALVDQTLVTPHMTQCMKAMQSGKLVLLCVYASEKGQTPQGVQDFCSDPHFQKRTAVIAMDSSDLLEKRFLKELEINPGSTRGTTVVFLAPPGMLVGKFAQNVTSSELASKLHASGKCCDDENCKHNKKGK